MEGLTSCSDCVQLRYLCEEVRGSLLLLRLNAKGSLQSFYSELGHTGPVLQIVNHDSGNLRQLVSSIKTLREGVEKITEANNLWNKKAMERDEEINLLKVDLQVSQFYQEKARSDNLNLKTFLHDLITALREHGPNASGFDLMFDRISTNADLLRMIEADYIEGLFVLTEKVGCLQLQVLDNTMNQGRNLLFLLDTCESFKLDNTTVDSLVSIFRQLCLKPNMVLIAENILDVVLMQCINNNLTKEQWEILGKLTVSNCLAHKLAVLLQQVNKSNW